MAKQRLLKLVQIILLHFPTIHIITLYAGLR